jgi:hypothetical protein
VRLTPGLEKVIRGLVSEAKRLTTCEGQAVLGEIDALRLERDQAVKDSQRLIEALKECGDNCQCRSWRCDDCRAADALMTEIERRTTPLGNVANVDASASGRV